MSERKTLPKGTARQIIQYQPVVDQVGEYGVYCIDKGVLRIIRHLLSTRGMWRSTYVIDYGDGFYLCPDTTEFNAIDNAISGFLGSNDMCNDLTDAILSLTATVGAGGCCGDGSGGVSPTLPFEDFEDDGSSTFPDGFEDREEYEPYKCNAAQSYLNDWRSDMNWLGNNAAGWLAGGAVVGVFLVPGINVAVLIGVATALIGLALLQDYTDDIADWLTANNDDLLCVLYNAASAEGASDALNAIIDSSSLGPFAQEVAEFWVTAGALNRLFEAGNVPSVAADCSECACQDVAMLVGTFDGEDEFTSSEHPSLFDQFIQAQLEVNVPGTHDYCNTCTLNGITISAGAPSGSGGAFAYRLTDSSGSVIYEANVLPSFPVADVSQITIADRAAPSNQIIATIDWSVD